MKCDELKEYYYYDDRVITPATHMYRVYHADKVDAAIAELKKENARLKDELDAANNQCENLINSATDIMLRQDKVNDTKCAEIESLKASHYAEMVDAGMRERRLRRALWIARVRALRDFLCQAIDQVDAMEEERRWRKCSEEMPPTDGSYMCAYKNKNKDDGVLFVDEAVWDGEKWSYKFDFWEDIIYWQFKPKAPEADK